MIRVLFVMMVSLLFCVESYAQVYTNKPVGEKNKALIDSLKQQEYPYVLPIWGEKAAKLGFEFTHVRIAILVLSN